MLCTLDTIVTLQDHKYKFLWDKKVKIEVQVLIKRVFHIHTLSKNN